ncbi:MAG: hypothetical protein JWP87_5105 [Labilithrix sp.]|nr:hypothetical protein [Labilithrix sp.]
MIRFRSILTPLTPIALASVLAGVAACGGAAEGGMPASKSPGAAPPADSAPSTIEEAQQQIAAARAELAGASASESSRFAPEPPAAAPPPPPASEPSRPSSTDSSAQRPSAAPKANADAADRCGSPCRALASMRRAVTALCRMTGDEDTRCVDAKRTLTDSKARIAPCSC